MQTLTAGVNSGTITVQIQDAGGNPINQEGSDRTVDLTTTSTGGIFRDTGDTDTITSVIIPVDADSASFLYKDTVAGTPTLRAATTSPTTLTSVTQDETVNPAVASKLVFTTTPVTVTAGVELSSITVEREDQYGNPNTSDAAILVVLASDLTGTVTFNPVSPLTIDNGESNVSFTYTDTKAGTPTITVQSDLLVDGTQQETVNPAVASKLVFTTTPVAVTAGVEFEQHHGGAGGSIWESKYNGYRGR